MSWVLGRVAYRRMLNPLEVEKGVYGKEKKVDKPTFQLFLSLDVDRRLQVDANDI